MTLTEFSGVKTPVSLQPNLCISLIHYCIADEQHCI